MTEDDKQKITAWLDKKWPPHKRICEVCGTNNWQLQEDIVTPLTFSKGSINLGGGRAYPAIIVICSNCTNTKYFNAALMGLIRDGGVDVK